MDPLTYLTTFSPDFGTLEWVFFIAQIAILAAGAYFGFLRSEAHPVRRAALARLGNAMLAVGAIGTLLGILRLTGLQLFTMPLWFAIGTALDAVLLLVALYYALAVYPARMRAYEEANRSRGPKRSTARSAPALQANGTNGAALDDARAAGSSTRRDARRDRKRRSR